ncbi:MAG TPA: aminotransferase class I/II-fold pyridoxal phosphate-dependent enzyme [Candidatus Eremiobacteraceae bacterium]|nr:aminotransferase class I/II-fold pyridoxal phosphate-dependent enzyme [Candidatus Eremiobacteraceae bacterium]
MSVEKSVHIETLAVHAGAQPEPATGAVSPSIHLSTIFERDADGGYSRGYSYQRKANPTRGSLETALAVIEGGAAAAAFSSGSAATATIMQTLSRGDHVILPGDAYYGTRVILNDCLTPWGLEATYVEIGDLEAVSAAVRPNTRMIWVETPSNPMLKVADISAVVKIAHKAGAICVCDNTLATPILSRPLSDGADFVVHATTKYIGGHSDVLGGAVIAREEGPRFERLRHLQHALGAVPSPFDCWLALRGMRTLALRVRAQSGSALELALFLVGHPKVSAVHYPGLKSAPGHAIAARQMSGFGGLLSFQVRGGEPAAMGVAARCRVFTRATSFGGSESLIEHRASIEGPGTTTPADLLRVSVGLEHPADLMEDLKQALL